MRRFLLVDQIGSAADYAAERDWQPISWGRYMTPEGDEVRVCDRRDKLCPTPGGLLFIPGPNYEQGTDALEFKRMLKEGEARWVKK